MVAVDDEEFRIGACGLELPARRDDFRMCLFVAVFPRLPMLCSYCPRDTPRQLRRWLFSRSPFCLWNWPYGRSGPLSLLRSVGVLRRTELYRLQIMACSCQEGVRRRRDCGAFLEGCLSNSRKAEGRRVHCRSRVLRPALSRLPAACPAEGFVSLAGCASCCWLHASPVSLPGFLKTAYILKRGRRPARMGRSRRLLRRGGRLRRAGCR